MTSASLTSREVALRSFQYRFVERYANSNTILEKLKRHTLHSKRKSHFQATNLNHHLNRFRYSGEGVLQKKMPIKEFWNDINSERKHRRAPPWSTTSCCDTPQTSTCCGCSSPSAPSGRDTLLKMIYLRMPWNILRTSPGYFVFSLIAQFQDSFRCVVDDKRICWSYIFQCSTISRYLLYHSEREFLSFPFADP